MGRQQEEALRAQAKLNREIVVIVPSSSKAERTAILSRIREIELINPLVRFLLFLEEGEDLQLSFDAKATSAVI